VSHEQPSRELSLRQDVGPFEAIDLGAAEAGVEGDRVRDLVLGFERG
jgi:hypothetical protein